MYFLLAGNRRASIHAIDIRHRVFRPMASKQSLLLLWSISGEMIQDSRVSCNHIFITKSWQFVLSHINLKIMLLLIFLRSISWTQGKLRWKFCYENIVITYVSKSHDFVTKMWEVTLLWWKCEDYIWIESQKYQCQNFVLFTFSSQNHNNVINLFYHIFITKLSLLFSLTFSSQIRNFLIHMLSSHFNFSLYYIAFRKNT